MAKLSSSSKRWRFLVGSGWILGRCSQEESMELKHIHVPRFEHDEEEQPDLEAT